MQNPLFELPARDGVWSGTSAFRPWSGGRTSCGCFTCCIKVHLDAVLAQRAENVAAGMIQDWYIWTVVVRLEASPCLAWVGLSCDDVFQEKSA